MTKTMTRFAAVLTVMLALAAGTTSRRASAYDVIRQEPSAPLVPVKVEIVLSRSQGDKKVSSLPYTIWANANGNNVSLRLGVDVPVGASLVTTGNENTSGSGRSTTTTSSTARTETTSSLAAATTTISSAATAATSSTAAAASIGCPAAPGTTPSY